MGCDIHLYVERKKVIDDEWASVDEWGPDEDYPECLTVDWRNHFYRDRNYRLFAILADVRNGYGFAGCDTGERLIPIAEPRGLPEDVSDLVRAESDYLGGDGHSHSWLTLAELLTYDWTQTATLRGWINGPACADWMRWRDEEPGPKTYSGGVSGQRIQHVPIAELEARVQAIWTSGGKFAEWEQRIREELEHVYAQAEWKQSYASCCRKWWSETMPRLLHVGEPERVRIVFWFDN